MESAFRIGRIKGIDINIHFTWLIVLGLLSWSLASAWFPMQYKGWSTATYWQVGIASSLLLFLSVLIHELSHSLVAEARGMPVKNITLFLFGGVSNIKGEPRAPFDELVMSIAGPAASVALAGVFAAIGFLAGPMSEVVSGVALYLFYMNLVLAAFNLLPGFPLDGGRVLRAILWWVMGGLRPATRVASAVGQGIAYLMIFGGLVATFAFNDLAGIWFVLIGWFLNNAAESSYRQVVMQERLRGVNVRDIMTSDFIMVEPHLSLRQFVAQFVLPHSQRAFPVVDRAALVGLMTLTDLRRIPQAQWDVTTVAEAMTPREKLRTVALTDGVQQVLEALGERDLNQLPVLDRGELVGMVNRSNLIQFLRVREELGLRA